jgi:dienelactone hydrolase
MRVSLRKTLRAERRAATAATAFGIVVMLAAAAGAAERLPGTAPLAMPKDPKDLVAMQLRQVLGYFQRRIDEAQRTRDRAWQLDFSSEDAYQRSAAGHRASCRRMLGLTDEESPGEVQGELVAASADLRIERLSVPVAPDLRARGIVFLPTRPGPRPLAIVCPDADTWPEQFTGLSGPAETPSWLRQLVGRGAAVYVPQSVERLQDHPYCQTTKGKDRRMVLYRLGYVVGRTVPGLDVQDVLAAMRHLAGRPEIDPARIGVAGIGQGGMTTIYAAAVAPRVSAAVVSGYFQERNDCWQEPVDRRLPAQFLEFGDAEVAAMVAPRPLWVLSEPQFPDEPAAVAGEVQRAARFYQRLNRSDRFHAVADVSPERAAGRSAELLAAELFQDSAGQPAGEGQRASAIWPESRVAEGQAAAVRNLHFEERLRYLRRLIADSEAKRQARWGLAECQPDDFPKIKAAMLADYRNLVGTIPTENVPLRPRSEPALSTDAYDAYHVLLDVAEGVEVYGHLLIPKRAAGRLPAVICQHGLSGLPAMITGVGWTEDTPYHFFGRRLAERGYVVFAPLVVHHHPVKQVNDQVRMADAVGMMRAAVVVAQTRRVVDFLQTLPMVDPRRIGYYGLSYGGYSALWVAPLEERLAAVVVSGHFNDWRSKITSDGCPASYLFHPDEDFYNWDVLERFTHVELVVMTAPRPVCVEYGRRDGITTPEWTAYAWRQLAAIRDRLGLADRIRLAEFDGVHEVHGVESFEFLDAFLRQ